MVSAVFGILAAYRDIIKRNAGAHPKERFGVAEFSRVEGANGDVRGVSPLGSRQGARLP